MYRLMCLHNRKMVKRQTYSLYWWRGKPRKQSDGVLGEYFKKKIGGKKLNVLLG